MTLDALVRLSVCALEAPGLPGTRNARCSRHPTRLVVRGRTTGAGGLWADEPVGFIIRARRARAGGLLPYVELDSARAGRHGDPRLAVPRRFRRPALGLAGLYGQDFQAAAIDLAAAYVRSTYL